jgi:hypothetical protein
MILEQVLWLVVLDLAAWAIGNRVTQKLVDPQAQTLAERVALPLVFGLCALGSLAFVLGVSRLLYPELLLGIAALFAWIGLRRLIVHRRPPSGGPSHAEIDVLGVLIAVFLFFHLFRCFDPLLEHDSLVYHLTIPKVYLKHHGIVEVPHHLYFNVPHNMEVLYTWALAWGGPITTRLLTFQFHVLILLGLGLYAARWPVQALGTALGLLYVSGPNIQDQFALSHTEPAIACFLLYAFLLLLRWNDDGRRTTLLGSSALAGWVLGCKYTAWFFVLGWLAALGAIAFLRPGPLRSKLRDLTAAAVVLGLFLGPWLLKAWITTGNPLYPSLYGVFGGRWWSPLQELQHMRYHSYAGLKGAPRTLGAILKIPWKLARRPDDFLTSPFSMPLLALFYVAPLLPWSYRGPAKLTLLAALTGFAAWTLSPALQGRYLVAVEPLMLLAVAPILSRILAAPRLRNACLAVLLFFFFHQLRGPTVNREPRIPSVSLELLSSRRYESLLYANNLHPLWDKLNLTLPPDAKVFAVFENAVYFLDREFWVDTVYAAPDSMAILREARTARKAAIFLAGAGVTHLVVNNEKAQWYFWQKFPKEVFDASLLLDPSVLPPGGFKRERRLFSVFLRRQTRHLFDVGVHSVYELKPPGLPLRSAGERGAGVPRGQ